MLIKYIIGFTMLATAASHTQADSSGGISEVPYEPLNIVTVDTQLQLGFEVAQIFSQLIYLENLVVRSAVEITEKRVSGNSIELSLQTPLRVLTTHRFSISQNRYKRDPHSIAMSFLTAAQQQGLLVSQN